MIICAPTSSGKTVLSSIVALIGKHNAQKDGNADQKSVKKVTEGLAKVNEDLDEISGDEDEDDEDIEGEGEGEGEDGDDEEDDEDEGEEEADLRRLNLKEQGQGHGQGERSRAVPKDLGIGSEQVSMDSALKDRLARFKFRYVRTGIVLCGLISQFSLFLSLSIYLSFSLFLSLTLYLSFCLSIYLPLSPCLSRR